MEFLSTSKTSGPALPYKSSMFGLACSKFGLKISGSCSKCSKFGVSMFKVFSVRYFGVRSTSIGLSVKFLFYIGISNSQFSSKNGKIAKIIGYLENLKMSNMFLPFLVQNICNVQIRIFQGLAIYESWFSTFLSPRSLCPWGLLGKNILFDFRRTFSFHCLQSECCAFKLTQCSDPF